MDRLRTIVRLVLALAALSFIGIYVVVTFLRIRYPFELEWMEGGTLVHAEISLFAAYSARSAAIRWP